MKSKKDLKVLLSSLFLLSVVGCVTGGPDAPVVSADPPPKRGIIEFEKANQLLDSKRYEEAALAFDKLRVQKPATTLDFFVLLNSGIAYQSGGDCKTAAERYRQTIRVTNKKSPETQAMARLRLSDVLACEGNDRLAIVNLVELYKSRRFLSPEIAQAEVPAKLAAAYARAENKKMAQKYFTEAEAGFRKMNSLNPKESQKPILAKTLFLMGNMSHLDPTKISSQDYYTSVKTLQGFLFRAVEMDVGNWSQLASDQIEQAYKKIWLFIDREAPSSEDSQLSQREIQAEKIKTAQEALVALSELKELNIPKQKMSKPVDALFLSLNKTERQIEGYLATNRIGSELTTEAQKARSVKQEGRIDTRRKTNEDKK